MKNLLTRTLAQEIVNRTIDIIGYNVNVMDKDGIIIGSGDQSRLFELHAGAVEAIAQEVEVEVGEEDLTRLKGTKTGINLPITFNEEIVGVIGITGPLDEIRGYGKLVKMAAELSLSQAFLTAELQWDTRHKEELVRQLIRAEIEDWNLFKTRAASLGLSISLPCEVICIDTPESDTRYNEERQKYALEEHFKEYSSLIQIQKDRYVLFLPAKKAISKDKLLHVASRFKLDVGYGTIAYTLDDIAPSYQKASYSINVGRFKKAGQRIHYYEELVLDVSLYKLSRSTDMKELKEILMPLKREVQTNQLLDTLESYIEHNGEVKQVAKALFVHRNTVQYRLQKIADITKKDPRVLEQLLELYVSLKLNQYDGMK
ncbi:sugar diacid recognition domain-containing protein [Alkalihalophilus pseudofirmus]|uniref:Sugar diacid recognition domain-containing protein n=1 Tax=Alkalihalophilus pseudofirmus TaxID=79885 RepID=A0AAJ2U4F1_ALKPS|nr:sugar diacid recognition domain-containing protein [Alkalihalophilus pseudofirmus]MDV2887145.1 sugar diacid recognition domain-containing protein [Alkalihalophilus pseudofirmus]